MSGVKILQHTQVKEVTKGEDGKELLVLFHDHSDPVPFDVLIWAIGRVPNIEINLPAANVYFIFIF